MTFSKSVSKRPNLCRNDSYIFGQKHVSVSKLHCVEIVCVEVTDTRRDGPLDQSEAYDISNLYENTSPVAVKACGSNYRLIGPH